MTGTRNLVIAPHHDDAEFGVGGILATQDDRDPVDVLVLAAGDYTSRDGRRISGDLRIRESQRALEHLGANLLIPSIPFHENRGTEWHYPLVVDVITRYLRARAYHSVYIPWPSFNQDHRTVFDACITALRPVGLKPPSLKRIWAYEYPGNGWAQELPAFGRSYTEISQEAMEDWMYALSLHKSQSLDTDPGHITLKGATALARLRGSEAGFEFAQCHWLIKEWDCEPENPVGPDLQQSAPDLLDSVQVQSHHRTRPRRRKS